MLAKRAAQPIRSDDAHSVCFPRAGRLEILRTWRGRRNPILAPKKSTDWTPIVDALGLAINAHTLRISVTKERTEANCTLCWPRSLFFLRKIYSSAKNKYRNSWARLTYSNRMVGTPATNGNTWPTKNLVGNLQSAATWRPYHCPEYNECLYINNEYKRSWYFGAYLCIFMPMMTMFP